MCVYLRVHSLRSEVLEFGSFLPLSGSWRSTQVVTLGGKRLSF